MINRKNVLKLEPRLRIYNFILENPGLHLREISRKMIIPKTTLSHHLKHLKKEDLIVNKNIRNYERYYVTDKLGKNEKETMHLLRQEVPRNILLYIICNLTASLTELSKELEKKPETILFHLRKLLDLELVEIASAQKNKKTVQIDKPDCLAIHSMDNNEKFYRLKNQIILASLLKKYRKSIMDKEYVIEYIFKHGVYIFSENPKKVKVGDAYFDSLIEKTYEIFPHPYYC